MIIPEFNYQTIVDAKAGDEKAIEIIVAYFEPYLVSMAHTPQYVEKEKSDIVLMRIYICVLN